MAEVVLVQAPGGRRELQGPGAGEGSSAEPTAPEQDSDAGGEAAEHHQRQGEEKRTREQHGRAQEMNID